MTDTVRVTRLPVLLRTAPRGRRGPLRVPLLAGAWVLLGVALVAYVVGMLALAFLAVLVATLRLLLTPPLSAVGRAVARARGAGLPARSLGG